MKKFGIVVAIFAVICISVFFFVKLQPTPVIEMGSFDLNTINDGDYQGEYTEGPVKVVLTAKVEDHVLKSIQILEHRTGLGKKAEKITQIIIDQQTIDVDVVSGATLSSNVIKKALAVALTQ